jgi:hypothetical protein
MKNRLLAVLITSLVLLLAAGQAFAATTATPQATITVTAGALSIASTGSITLPGITLDGDDHDMVATAAPTFTLIDARGSGGGWNVTFQSSDFAAAGGKTITASNLKFTSGGTITRNKGQAVDGTNGPKETALSAVGLNTAQKVITTAANYGKGNYTYTPTAGDFVLTVTADTLAGAYTATVTATIVAGP